MASRIIAQLLVAGTGALFRAASQAWQQAIVNGRKAGLDKAAGAAGGAVGKRAGASMTLHEANLILGVQEAAEWDVILKRYDHLIKVNEEVKSFYLQSKVYRAKERIMLERGITEDPRGFAASGAEAEAEAETKAEGTAEGAEAQRGGAGEDRPKGSQP